MLSIITLMLIVLIFLRLYKVNLEKVNHDGLYLVYEITRYSYYEKVYYNEVKKVKLINYKDNDSNYDFF